MQVVALSFSENLLWRFCLSLFFDAGFTTPSDVKPQCLHPWVRRFFSKKTTDDSDQKVGDQEGMFMQRRCNEMARHRESRNTGVPSLKVQAKIKAPRGFFREALRYFRSEQNLHGYVGVCMERIKAHFIPPYSKVPKGRVRCKITDFWLASNWGGALFLVLSWIASPQLPKESSCNREAQHKRKFFGQNQIDTFRAFCLNCSLHMTWLPCVN